MRRWIQTVSLALCALAAAAVTATPADDPFFRSLVSADRAFAGMAASDGTKPAYLKYLAEDSILFTLTGTELARPSWEAAEVDYGLDWAPAVAEVSRSGDLGYTHGAGTINVTTPTGEKRYPYYSLLLWERNAQGQWRVAMDDSAWTRTAAKPTDASQRGPRAQPGLPLRSVERNVRLQSLVRTDRALVRALMSTPATAYQAFRRDDCLFLRDWQPPKLGAEADAILATYPARPLDSLELVRLSASGEMAFTVGLWPGKGGPAAYTRVWRFDGKRWLLVVDSTHYPAAAAASTAAPLPRRR